MYRRGRLTGVGLSSSSYFFSTLPKRGYVTSFSFIRDLNLLPQDKGLIIRSTSKGSPSLTRFQNVPYQRRWQSSLSGPQTRTLSDGRVFEGEWKDGQPHGKGKMTLPPTKGHSSTIEGTWVAGKLEGRAKCTRQDGVVIYDLNFKAGNVEGFGSMLLKSTGTIYEGEWKNSLPHGRGVEKTRDKGAVIYEGEWKDGLYEGNGKLTPPQDSSVYEGEFVAGQPHGWGIEISATERYEGEWQHGWFHGKGKVVQYHEKSKGNSRNEYEGEFHQGVYHGKGVLRMIIERSPSSEPTKAVENKKEKKPQDKWALIDLEEEIEEEEEEDEEEEIEEGVHVFEGEWLQGRFTGKGRVVSPDGSIHEGYFKDGMRHGKGKVIAPNGEVYEGEWADDEVLENKGGAV